MLRFKKEDGSFYPDWKKIKINDLGEFIGGGTPSTKNKEYWTGDIPWLSSSDLEEENVNKIKISKYINKDAIEHSSTRLITKDSVMIVSRVGLGKVAVCPCNLCTSQDFTSIVKNDNWNSKFLAYSLSVIMNHKKKESQGTAIKGVSTKDIKETPILLPNYEEQNKIAEFLTEIDNVIECSEKEVESLEQQKKGLIQKIFSQEVRLKKEDGSEYPTWNIKRLKEIGSFSSGFGFNEKYQGNKDKDIMFFKVSDMNIKGNEIIMRSSNNTVDDDILSEMKLSKFTQNGILFAKVGAAIYKERKRLVYSNFLMDNNMMAFFPKNESLEFIYYLFCNTKFLKYAQTGALPSYNSSDLGSIKVNIPCIEEQKKIADFLSSFDEAIDAAKEELETWKNIKKGLLQQMFE